MQFAGDRGGDLGIAFGAAGGEEAVGRQTGGARGEHVRTLDQDNFATRRAWCPPSNAVEKNTLRQSFAVSSPMTRAQSARTLASLCWRARRAVKPSWQSAARIAA